MSSDAPTPAAAHAAPEQTPTAGDAMPAAAPALQSAQSSYIELDTSRGAHVPHPTETQQPNAESSDAAAAAAAAEEEEDAADDAAESEPLSEVDEVEDGADRQRRLDDFLAAMHLAAGAGGAANVRGATGAGAAASSADEAFSETEQGGVGGGLDATQAAIAEVQEFLNRQHAAQAAAAAAAAGGAANTSAAGPTPADRAAARQQHKADFAARMEARKAARRAAGLDRDAEEEEEEEEEEDGAAQGTPAARAARAQAEDEEEAAEDEDEEEEEEVDESFLGWLKTRAGDVLNGKTGKRARAGARWLTSSTISWAGKGLYVLGTLALVAVPLIASELNESAQMSRQRRFMQTTHLTEDQKQQIWMGTPPASLQGDGAMDMTLVQ